jgi:hypothetical protein
MYIFSLYQLPHTLAFAYPKANNKKVPQANGFLHKTEFLQSMIFE